MPKSERQNVNIYRNFDAKYWKFLKLQVHEIKIALNDTKESP